MTRVVTISGSGRSGSTLLSLMLAQDPAVFNLGQMRHLWRAYGDDEDCSCGVGLSRCAVYGPVVAAGNAPPPARMHSLERKFLDAAGRAIDWGDPRVRERITGEHAEFLGGLGSLLAALGETTGASAFVDSSKIPSMAFAFDLLPGVDTYVLNLVRDPRAVAVSWQRRKNSMKSALTMAMDWGARQRRLEQWRPTLAGRFMTLRYEDFAAEPAAAIDAIAAWSGLPIPAGLFLEPDRVTIDWSNIHLYAPANESVLALRESDVRIASRDSWRDPGNRVVNALTGLLVGRRMRQYYKS